MARVTELRFVGYGVPDLDAERGFYRDVWRLREAGVANDMVYFAAEGSDEHHVVRLRQSADPRVDVIAFAAASREEVDQLYQQVTAAGCRIIFEPCPLNELGGGYGFRFFSPDGLPFEISSDVARGTSRVMKRWESVPQKISHIVLHSPDVPAASAFFTDVLGFRITDWVGEFMVFIRCNDVHHRIALLPGPPCIDHVAYELLSIDDVMRGIKRLAGHGVDIKWGPGRHMAGDNTFSYFLTPNNFVVEYTSDLGEVADDHVPNVYSFARETMDQWGIGVGGPQSLPTPAPDNGLFQPASF